MRILMLNNEFPPLGGGMGTVNLEILKQFAGLSHHEIDLVTSSAQDRFVEEHIGDRIRIFRLPVNVDNPHHATNLELVRYAGKAFWFVQRRQRANPYGLCFAWSAVPAGGVAFLINRLYRLPYVVRVCGPDIPGFERRYAGLYPLLTPMIRAIWQSAVLVIAKCQEEVDMIRAVDRRIDPQIIPNGVSLENFGSLLRLGGEGPLRVLCVGRLIERKSQHDLIEVARRMVEKQIPVVLDFVGTGDGLETYQAKVVAAGLQQVVNFHGYVPHEEIGAYYQRADVFILPSYNEGMSVATLEAMAAGLPVIVTKTGGSLDLVNDGENGFIFNWGDIDRLEKLLVDLENNRSQLIRMGEASRARAAKFTWRKAAAQYLSLFDELNISHPEPKIVKNEKVH